MGTVTTDTGTIEPLGAGHMASLPLTTHGCVGEDEGAAVPEGLGLALALGLLLGLALALGLLLGLCEGDTESEADGEGEPLADNDGGVGALLGLVAGDALIPPAVTLDDGLPTSAVGDETVGVARAPALAGVGGDATACVAPIAVSTTPPTSSKPAAAFGT